MDEIQVVVASLHEALAKRGGVIKGFRDGDQVCIEFQGVEAFGTVALSGASGVRIGEVPVALDGTGQTVRVPEKYVEVVCDG